MATLYSNRTSTVKPSLANLLPQLLHTPTGLAFLELQGTINVPFAETPVVIGRLDFPDYTPDSLTFDPASTAWMRRVHMWIGQHQRLTGEVRKLPRAVAIVKRREEVGEDTGKAEELDVVEIVKYKIVFAARPEPVGTVELG